MVCPKCRTATLASLVPYAAEPPHRCSGCGGYWVPLAVAARLAEFMPEDAAGTTDGPAPAAADARAGLCPNGHGLLVFARIELDGHFYLDRCPTCSGVWFDRGEWETGRAWRAWGRTK